MNYGYTKQIRLDFPDAIKKTKQELTNEGFGILTEIDVQSTLRNKLHIDFDDYLILGVCNPPFAHKALQAETEIGLLLPCNVIIYRKDGNLYVSAILPQAAMSMIENDQLKPIAQAIEQKLIGVIDKVCHE